MHVLVYLLHVPCICLFSYFLAVLLLLPILIPEAVPGSSGDVPLSAGHRKAWARLKRKWPGLLLGEGWPDLLNRVAIFLSFFGQEGSSK